RRGPRGTPKRAEDLLTGSRWRARRAGETPALRWAQRGSWSHRRVKKPSPLYMNLLVENLNIWGSSLADIAFGMLIQYSMFMIVLFLLDLVIRQIPRAVLRYG